MTGTACFSMREKAASAYRVYVKGNCKIHRAVYDKLNEVLAELQRIESGGTVDDELMSNVKLIAGIIDNLYIKTNI